MLQPLGNLLRDAALLPLAGAGRVGAVLRQFRHGQAVTASGHHFAGHVMHENRSHRRHYRPLRDAAGQAGRHFEQAGKRLVDGRKIAFNCLAALAAIGFFDRLLDRRDRFIRVHHAGQLEEAHLHDGVDAPPHAGGLGDLVGVDGVYPDCFSTMCRCSDRAIAPQLSGGYAGC